MKDLREDLDDLYSYQAEDAPPWFRTKEKLGRWTRGNNRRGNRQPVPIPTQAQITEKDEDDQFFSYDEYDLEDAAEQAMEAAMEEDPIPEFDGAGDEAAASGEGGEMKADEVDKAVERPEAIEGVEAVESVELAAAVQGGGASEVDPFDKEQTQLDESAWWDGGAKKKSFRSWVGRIVRRTQDRLAKRGLDKTLEA